MSISETTKIDYVGIKDGCLTLVITDHLDWLDADGHLALLQEKINAYLSYCLDGQLDSLYPIESRNTILIQIVSEFPYPQIGIEAVAKVKSFLERNYTNITLSQETIGTDEVV